MFHSMILKIKKVSMLEAAYYVSSTCNALYLRDTTNPQKDSTLHMYAKMVFFCQLLLMIYNFVRLQELCMMRVN